MKFPSNLNYAGKIVHEMGCWINIGWKNVLGVRQHQDITSTNVDLPSSKPVRMHFIQILSTF